MRRLLTDKRAETTILVLFIVLAICMLFACAYSFAMIYTKGDDAKKELQRAATLAVDIQLENKNVRDLVFEVQSRAPGLFNDNLEEQGFVKSGNSWLCNNAAGTLIYKFNDLSISISGRRATVTGTVDIVYPWAYNGTDTVTLPILVQSNVIYIYDEVHYDTGT